MVNLVQYSSDKSVFLLLNTLLLGLLTLAQQGSNPTVTLFTTASSGGLSITCDVKTATPLSTKLKLHLLCPFSPNALCYRNCSAQTNLPAILECKYSQLSSNNMQFIYKIDLSQIDKTGTWLCSYAGVKSNDVRINAAPLPFSLSTTRLPTTSTTTPIKPKTTTSVSALTSIKSTNGFVDNSNKEGAEQTNSTKKEIANPQLVLVLLILLLTSVLVNVGFCIRCILVRNYIEKVRSGERTDRCIERCLCLDPDPRRLFWKMYNKESSLFRDQSVREAALLTSSPPESPRYNRISYLQRPSFQGEMFHDNSAQYFIVPVQNTYSPMTELVDNSGSNSVQLLYHPICNTFPRAPHQMMMNSGAPIQTQQPVFHQSWDGNAAADRRQNPKEKNPHLPSTQQGVYDEVPSDSLCPSNVNPLYARVHHPPVSMSPLTHRLSRSPSHDNYASRQRRSMLPDPYGQIVVHSQMSAPDGVYGIQTALPGFAEEFENVENTPTQTMNFGDRCLPMETDSRNGHEYEQVIVGSSSGLSTPLNRRNKHKTEPVQPASPISSRLMKAPIV